MSVAIHPATTENIILFVIVRDREGVLFEGEAEAVSSVNAAGPFDILPLHANFISIISQTLTLHVRGGVTRELPIRTGVLIVRENKVEVYIGILH